MDRFRLLLLSSALFLALSPGGAAGSHLPPDKPFKGLAWRTDLPPIAHDGVVDHAAFTLYWEDLEPSPGGFVWTSLDSAISAASSRDPDVKLRLRIMTGRDAPEHIKALGGRPGLSDTRGITCTAGIAIYNFEDESDNGFDAGKHGCVPYFWLDDYLDRYRSLMVAVRNRVLSRAGGSIVLDVVNSACMTIYAEPFYKAHKDTDSNRRLWIAGLNNPLGAFAGEDAHCLERSMEIHRDVFHSDRTTLAINPWDQVVDPLSDPDGVVQTWAPVQAFVERWRASDPLRLGTKLILMNTGLGEDEGCNPNKENGKMYCYLETIAPPKGFQTETWERLGSSESKLQSAVAYAVAKGACFIELPGRSGVDFSVPPWTDLDLDLESNCLAA